MLFADKAAHFLSELNVIHAFREGNGRSQLTFFALLADHAGHCCFGPNAGLRPMVAKQALYPNSPFPGTWLSSSLMPSGSSNSSE